MSLVEVLIACSVTAMLFVLIGEVIVPVFRAVSRQSLQTTMAQQAVVALNRLEWDLRHTTRYGTTVLTPALDTEPVALGINRFSADTFLGQPVWEPSIVAYVWTPRDHRLVRRTCPPVPSSVLVELNPLAPTACTQAQLADIAATAGPQDAVLASGVTRFAITVDGVYKVTLSMEEVAAPDDAPRRVETARSFHLRNHL